MLGRRELPEVLRNGPFGARAKPELHGPRRTRSASGCRLDMDYGDTGKSACATADLSYKSRIGGRAGRSYLVKTMVPKCSGTWLGSRLTTQVGCQQRK